MTPLLELQAARIDRDGTPLLESLSARGEGPRLGLLGDWSALFSLFGAAARVASGRVTVAGTDAQHAVAEGVLGLVVTDPFVPRDWNVDRYLIEGARLDGAQRRAARDTARASLATLGLGHLATRRLGTLTTAEKRAVLLAAASMNNPPVLAVEDPARDLDERGERLLLELVERAAEGRALIVSANEVPSTGPTRALLSRVNQVLVLEAQTLVGDGTLDEVTAPGARFVLSVSANGGALAERLRDRGVAVEVARETGGFAALGAEVAAHAGGATRLLVQLPDGETTDAIVDAALGVGAPIVELRPLSPPPGS